MRINNNMSAVITNNQLLGTENSLAKSMERLSSGLQINHAGDNPSGIAIAGKMTSQIDGLDKASNNANDGKSVLETADGALNEVTAMIQRIRELAIQAANDINAQSEKNSIQQEIESLKEEIDRVSQTTEFNTKILLDGSLNARVYAENCSRVQTSNYVASGNYMLTVNKAAERAQMSTAQDMTGISRDIANSLSTIGDCSMTINGYSISFTEGMTDDQIFIALREGAEIGEARIKDDFKGFESTAFGNDAVLDIGFSDVRLAAIFGLDSTFELSDKEYRTTGTNPEVELQRGDLKDASGNVLTISQFTTTSTIKYEGNKVTVTDVGGFELSFLLDEGYEKDKADPLNPGEKYDGIINFNVTEVGIMRLQIGANEGQTMNVRIPSTDCKSLYIDDTDVTTVNGAQRAIAQMDFALTKINSIRSQLGAYENRLDHTTASLDETGENMTSALSRIEDVDMATEMVEYTKLNVLAQAATSALSQANELPQLALSLLK